MFSVVLIVMTWCVISFTDLIFKTCLFVPYLKTLTSTGINISPFKISWSSTHLPRTMLSAVQKRAKFFRIWFDIGALFACIFLVPSAILYFFSMHKISFHGITNTNSTVLLVPMIPGYTFPVSDLIILFLVAMLCSVFHEFGHAAAAKREQIGVESYGFGILLIFPWAFTNLNREQLQNLSDWQKLRIYAAGVWHNIVLSIMAAVFLVLNPYPFMPFYSYGQGITVLSVQGYLNGSTGGLKVGDQIFSINDCSVTDITSWEKCLILISEREQRGYCVPNSFILHEDIALKGKKHHDCCGANTTRHMCFKYFDEMIKKEACLPARGVTGESHLCVSNSNCGKESLCVIPLPVKKSDRFVEIHRNNSDSVLFIGLVRELSAYVKTSNAIARSKLIPVTFVEAFEAFLIYTLYFSSGYACLNLLPCPFFDGDFISEIILFKVLSSLFGKFVAPRNLLTCIKRFHVIFAILMFFAIIPYFLHCVSYIT